MIKEIKYNGHTANLSDYESPDGDLATAIGLITEDGTLKPVLPPSEVLELNVGEAVKYIHTTSVFTHYIVYDNYNIYSIDKETKTRITIGRLNGVTHFNAVGNTLLAFSPTGINYYLWKSDAYKSLGDHIPDVEMSFGLVGHPRLFSLSDESKSTFWISFDNISESTLYNEFSEDNKKKITEQVMAKVNKFVAQETVNKGRFCFPFFVRYAIKLYDGSLVCHSAPILMNPSTKSCPVVYWKRVKGENNYDKAECDIMLVAATLDYRIIWNADYYTLVDDWTDIIKSVEVFISKPIYTYDQNGLVTSFSDTDNFDTKFIGRLYADNPDTATGTPTEDKLLGVYQSKNFLSFYSEWLYSRIYSMYYSAYRSFPDTTIHLPEFSENKVSETVKNTSAFYKFRSLDIADIKSTTARQDIIVEDEYLQSLVNREVMTDDYLSRDKLYADHSFVYNQRLNLSGLKRNPFRGFLAQSMLSYVNCLYDWKREYSVILNITEVTQSFDNYRVRVYIKENGEDHIVECTTINNDPYPLALFNSQEQTMDNPNRGSATTQKTKRSWGTYFFYPNPNAYKMIIYNHQEPIYAIDLKQHEFLNGAFAVLEYDLLREKNFTSLPAVYNSGLINIPNKIYTSEVNNPFYFPLLGINTVGTGTILGICAAAKALSEGQFGQFPLYALTTEGVWALEVSATGTYSAKQPITRDVCINTDSITQIDSAVLFATNRGIMLISGSVAQCITDIINAPVLFSVADLPKHEGLISAFNKKADENEKLTAEDITLMPFLDFLASCRMVYDYTHQRIIVYNPNVRYAYVYSLKTQGWGMMLSDIKDNVNSYPEALAMSTKESNGVTIPVLVDFTIPSSDSITALVITRPFKLDDPNMFKTIDTIIQRGFFKSKQIQQVLYGSNDMYNWHIVWSSADKYLRGFRGTPYKAFRLALVCRLDKSENLYGCTVQFNPRKLNQPR